MIVVVKVYKEYGGLGIGGMVTREVDKFDDELTTRRRRFVQLGDVRGGGRDLRYNIPLWSGRPESYAA